MSRPLRVEFHCHTIFSRDSLNFIPGLIENAKKRNVDRLVITDHNSIEGAVIAKKLDPQLIIIGEEIMTTKGELLAAYVSETIPAMLAPAEAIKRLRDQGAFISVSHPFDLRRHGWALPDLEAITGLVDAIEIFNSRCTFPSQNIDAQKYARQFHLPGTAGSDAHIPFEVGRAVLVVPEFQNAEELKSVIAQAELDCRLSPWWVHLGSGVARLYKALRPIDNDKFMQMF
jgi:predicted metal-dependent phosphoesterase TrpH